MSSQARMSQFVRGLLAEIIKKRFVYFTFMSGGLKVKGLFFREQNKTVRLLHAFFDCVLLF